MALLLALALAVRLPALTASPPFVHGDEAECGLFARLFLHGGAPLLSIQWYGLPMLSYALSGLGMGAFGDTLTGLRLTNVVIGSASVALLYLLGRELFGRRAAFLGALVLAVTFLHADLSRDGIHYIQAPTAITLTLYLLARWLRHGGLLAAFLAGVGLIVDLQVYFAARVAPFIVAAVLVYLLATERRLLWARRRGLLWLFVGLIVSGLPLAALFLANPGSFSGRQGEVNLFAQGAGWLQGTYGTNSPVAVLAQQLWTNWTTFSARGDASLQIGWNGAMLDPISAALLPAALILALLRWRRWEYVLCLAWFVAVFVGGVLTINPPWWPRLCALLPAVALLIGLLLDDAGRLFARRWPAYRPIVAASVAILLVGVAMGNLRLLFGDYPAAARQASPMSATLIGDFLARTPGANRTVLLSDGSGFLDHPTIQFLAPHAAGCTLLPGQPLSHCAIASRSTVFVFLSGRVQDLPWLERQRPGGAVVDLGAYGYGSARLIAYTLPAGGRR